MPLSIQLFPDIDGLENLISESELVLQVWVLALAIIISACVIGACVARCKRRSAVEKIIRRRLR